MTDETETDLELTCPRCQGRLMQRQGRAVTAGNLRAQWIVTKRRCKNGCTTGAQGPGAGRHRSTPSQLATSPGVALAAPSGAEPMAVPIEDDLVDLDVTGQEAVTR